MVTGSESQFEKQAVTSRVSRSKLFVLKPICFSVAGKIPVFQANISENLKISATQGTLARMLAADTIGYKESAFGETVNLIFGNLDERNLSSEAGTPTVSIQSYGK